jgi:hypothetical protein
MTENGVPVSPPPDASALSPTALAEALRALPYRQAALLTLRLVQGRSREDCAAFYGISPAAFSVHLLRAALALATVAHLPSRPPAEEAEEDVWSRALAEALEREPMTAPAGLAPVVALCRRLQASGSEVAATLDAIELAEASSPRRQREDWLRRVAILALLALTAFLYWNRPAEPPERPARPAPARR